MREDRRVGAGALAARGRGGCAHARRGARAAASLARRGRAHKRKGGPRAPLPTARVPRSALRAAALGRLALGCRLLGCAGLRLAVRLLGCAGFRLAPACAWLRASASPPACAWPSTSWRPLLRLAGLRLRCADFRFAGLRLAADFFAAGLALRRRLRASPACRFAAVRLLGRRLLRFAGLRLAADRFLARTFSCCCHAAPFPFRSSRALGVGPYDAMRFRRRRSRSLMPPHTPYRSSRRSA